MIVFPNAKINLGLNILNKRADGYHNIASCFYPVNWCDVLEIVISDKFDITLSGIPIPGKKNDNLIVKAYQLLKEKYDVPPVNIQLHKIIPIGAGLGGGSADCAFAIKAFNELFKLELSDKEMEAYAAKLGSDCPFFIKNIPVNVSGTGNVFGETSVNLTNKFIVLVYPDLHISTGEAYSGIIPKQPAIQNQEILSGPMHTWKNDLKNDFEESVFPKYPELEALKKSMYDVGATYASMTGSGSTIFGIFEEKMMLKVPSNYTIYAVALQ